MNPARLRWLIRRYGNVGVLLVACILVQHHLWTKRRVSLLASLFAFTIALVLLWPHHPAPLKPSPAALPSVSQPIAPTPPPTQEEETGEEPDTPTDAPEEKPFSPPYQTVLKMTPDQFVEYYAAHTESNHEPGSACGASYRNAMCLYARCLRKRTDQRARHLPRARRRIWRRLETSMDRWLANYYEWNMLFNTDGTFWASAWANHVVEKEQALERIEALLKRSDERASPSSLKADFVAFRQAIHRRSPSEVYDIDRKPEFDIHKRRISDATEQLWRTIRSLPPHAATVLVLFFKDVRDEVEACASS